LSHRVRRVLVTGAARGIGRAIARHFGSLGDRLALVDRDDDGREVAQQVGGEFFKCDLSDATGTRRAVRDAWEKLGGLDVVINNAADHGPLVPLLELADTDWQRVLEANLTGTFSVSTEFARLVESARVSGVILNLLAIQTRLPINGYGAYIASKGGIEALTRAMAVEFAKLHIRVNGLMLGAIYSDSTREALRPAAASDDLEAVPAVMDSSVRNLVGRMGRPSDVAKVVDFLTSDAAAYIDGAVLVVDGGRLLLRDAADPLVPPLTAPPARSERRRQA
jgi:NAD(P)-dependent dehydrogenase (short-subunit alcohol dehydrogenase family)